MLPKQQEEKKKEEHDDINDLQYALISAAMRGDLQETKELLTNPNININGQDEKGNSAMHWASYFDEMEVLEVLVNSANIELGLQSKRGMTCLHMAAIANAGKCLTYLLNLGSKQSEKLFNQQNFWGETALHLAASTGKVKAIEILCKKNVDVSIRDNWNRTPLRVAFENLEQDAINTLSEYCSIDIIEDAKKVEESRIKLGKDIEQQQQQQHNDANNNNNNNKNNEDMMKEFMNEMQNMQKKIKESLSFEKLKEKHAFDVGGKVVDKKNMDPAKEIELKSKSKPKKYKYKLSSKFEYGVSPKTLEELEQWLGDDEIDNNGKDLYGWTALHKVIFWQKHEYVLPLLDNMSQDAINDIGPEGNAAIHMALTLVLNGGKKKILESLLSCEKINKLLQNKSGLTVKQIATKNNADQEIINLLE